MPWFPAQSDDGAWHGHPPSEVAAAERQAAAEIEANECAQRPHVIGRLSHDRETLVVVIPGRSRRAYLWMSELRQAARQSDAEGRTMYGCLLAEVEEKLANDWR